MARILLVDDDPAALQALASALAVEFEVSTSPDGASAWQYLEQASVSLVISDLRMPHMSGGVLCEKIRDDARLASLPVILMSGEYSPPAFVRYDCYLRKPVNTAHLIATINRLLSADSHRAPGTPQTRNRFI